MLRIEDNRGNKVNINRKDRIKEKTGGKTERSSITYFLAAK